MAPFCCGDAALSAEVTLRQCIVESNLSLSDDPSALWSEDDGESREFKPGDLMVEGFAKESKRALAWLNWKIVLGILLSLLLLTLWIMSMMKGRDEPTSGSPVKGNLVISMLATGSQGLSFQSSSQTGIDRSLTRY
jgi:hypothetical protein